MKEVRDYQWDCILRGASRDSKKKSHRTTSVYQPKLWDWNPSRLYIPYRI